jgi:hypothetical protein
MSNHTCPDCKVELTPIQLFARGWENPLTGVAVDTGLNFYTDTDADRSLLSGMFKPKGQIESYLCPSCGRIYLFGVENKL